MIVPIEHIQKHETVQKCTRRIKKKMIEWMMEIKGKSVYRKKLWIVGRYSVKA